MHLDLFVINSHLPFPLEPAMHLALYSTAVEIKEGGVKSRKVRGEGFEGRVASKNRRACLGGMSGDLFEANIETERGSGRVTFIVRHVARFELEDAAASNAQWN